MVASEQAQLASRWEDVRLFLSLYRERTLAGAGDQVGLDASTLSRRLAALEEALATRLFERTREGLVPTEGAELLLPAAEEMAAAHARFLTDASGFERAAAGTVRLSVPPGLAESFVGPALVRLREQHPRIQVELDVSLRFADLTRREADLAVRTRLPQSGDLVSVKLGERRWTPMVAAGRASTRKAVGSWGDLPWIVWGEEMRDFPPARWLAKHVPRASIVLCTNHFTTQVAAVAAGLGAALLPPVFARLAAVAPARYREALASSVNDLPVNETWLIGHRALRTVPRVAAVWAFLVEEFTKFEPRPGSRAR
jgi:DNA-binding transcriptional LysR family regulator